MEKEMLSVEREQIVSELSSIVQVQTTLLIDYIEKTQSEFARLNPISQKHLQQVIGDAKISINQLHELEALAVSPLLGDEDLFTQIIICSGYVLKRASIIRALLLRHSPPLRGWPSSLAPEQSIFGRPRKYTVDYLRGGYILYQNPGSDISSLYADHPVIASETSKVLASLYGKSHHIQALAFNSGIGAADAILDVLAARSLQSQSINLVPSSCWIEISRRIKSGRSDLFHFYDDNDLEQIVSSLSEKDIQSIFIEPIQNNPTMQVLDIQKLINSLKSNPPKDNVFIIIDHVMTFDFDVFSKFKEWGWPKNVTVVAFISGIKFLQYGIDAGKCGFVIANKGHESDELFHELIEHRAGTGKSPSYEDLMYANMDTSRSIHSRMARYDRNMKYMTESLSNKIKNYATVISPWLSEHPSCQISKVIYGHGGRVAYLRLHNPPDPVGTATLELYRIIGVHANERQIPLIAASNFGFSMPHYHIVRHEKFGLSLRISSGSIDSKNLERVINFLGEEITQFQLRRHHA